MSEPVPYGGYDGPLAKRESRALERRLYRAGAASRLQIACIDNYAAEQAARAESIAEVTHVVLQSVGKVSMHAEQLGQMIPSATGRFQAVVDAMTVAEIGVIYETGRRLR